METANILGVDITIPIKYVSGPRDLSPAESATLQTAFRTNLLSYAHARAKKLVNGSEEGLSDEQAAALRADIATYADLFTAADRKVSERVANRIGKAEPVDPETALALRLIKDVISRALREREQSVPRGEAMAVLAEQVLAGPQGKTFRKRAREQLGMAGQLDLEDYLAGMPKAQPTHGNVSSQEGVSAEAAE
jgi:hypothetical protein